MLLIDTIHCFELDVGVNIVLSKLEFIFAISLLHEQHVK